MPPSINRLEPFTTGGIVAALIGTGALAIAAWPTGTIPQIVGVVFAAGLCVFMVFDVTVARLLMVAGTVATFAALPALTPIIIGVAIAASLITPLLIVLWLSDEMFRFLNRKESSHDH